MSAKSVVAGARKKKITKRVKKPPTFEAAVEELDQVTTLLADAIVELVDPPKPQVQFRPKPQCRPPLRVVEDVPAVAPGAGPVITQRTLDYFEVPANRHIHCDKYEACLNAVLKLLGKRGGSWACPKECAGWKTFVEFPKMDNINR